MTGSATPSEIDIRLTRAEVQLLQTALRLLRSMLGRDEADELAAVQALLDRLEAA
jgi:hypothetical protein